MQALDVALKHGTALNPEVEAVARAFFIRSTRAMSIGKGAEVCLYSCLISPMAAVGTPTGVARPSMLMV